MKMHTFNSGTGMIPAAAETIMFLHGGNVAGWMWGQQVPAFPDYRVLVPDLPGFGASNQLPWISLEQTADALADLIPDNTHVVGLSLGSGIGLHLAARHPKKVASLFLASAQVAPPARRDVLIGRAMLHLWNQRRFWTTQARSYGLTGEDAELFITTGLGIEKETARAILDEAARGIPPSTLARVAVPTMAVAGGADSVSITRTSLDRILTDIPSSIAATVPEAHHQWNIERVEIFNDSVRAWLTDRVAASGLDVRHKSQQSQH